MFASHAQEQGVIAFQLMAALEQYELDLGRLQHRFDDMAIYAELADQFNQMQLFASALPQIVVNWVQLLISRYELTNCLRLLAGNTRVQDSLMRMFENHQRDAAALRGKCARQIPRH